MAEGTVIANDVVYKNVKVYGNNAAHVKVSTAVPSISGYTPIGIIGYYPQGGWDIGENISQININENTIDLVWSTAIPTNQWLVVTVLYIKS